MIELKSISTISFHPSLDMGNDEIFSQSNIAMKIAKALFGKLQGFDLENIYDFNFNNRLAICKNMVELMNTLGNNDKLLKESLAFATTLNFEPVSAGYNFKLKNDHNLEQVELIKLDYHGKPEILLPLHNLFRLLDGKEPVFITEESNTSFLEIEEVNSLFPYFQVVKAGKNPYLHHIGFTDLTLLEKLNALLAEPSTNLGFTMYKFLNQGKDSESYPTKYFDKQCKSLELVA